MKNLFIVLLFLGLLSPITTINAYSVPYAYAKKDKKTNLERGQASYYADKFNGKTTASGEKFSNKKLTAAHKTLPFGTMVRVTNLANGKSVDVRINDRGPFVKGRIIDLSKAAAQKIDMLQTGIAEVTIEVLK